MKKKSCALLVFMVLSVVIVLLSHSHAAAEACTRWVGKAVSVQGRVEVRRNGETRWQAVRLNDVFCPRDTIRVQEKSRAAIFLMNESTLRLDQNTSVTFSEIEEEKTSVIDLITGIVHFFSRIPRSLKVATPFVNGTVEGTEFLVSVEKDKSILSVFEGQVVASNEAGSIMLSSGHSAVAEKGRAPFVSMMLRPRDTVQWTLYYPVITYAPQAEWQREVSSLLSVGRVDEAGKVIEKILSESPNNSDALAFQAVIALALNERAKALSISNKAVEADPRSSSARIALSYALQAHLDLNGSLESLKDAAKLDPKNALAWARLAELWMSGGHLSEALKAANKAVALDPNVSRTQTILGFVYLAQIDTRTSRGAFEKAIELDQADPLPRLGLGLAKIRDGELVDGREEIEISASLDPNNSLVRSYLGKAFYEEKRGEKASNQFGVARDLDPLDPTPFFYDAILKQSINRPVEALHDLQEAISLNDNREVYRSRLLLDSDLAARSASLARIYNDLGFQQAGLVEGWRSVNTDPANFSGHRFLSDTYGSLPRHEIARVSELLQSQLLQPVNITPVQPILGEANLFLLRGAEPLDTGYNEFNPLFNRNRLALQLSGVAGGNSTFGEEAIVSGVYKQLSFSLGQFHYETNGFRANNDQQQNIYDVFAQYSFSEKTSIQTEFRYRDTENGDLRLNFFPEDFSPNSREKGEDRSLRFGFHHAFTPGSDLIGSFIYQNTKTSLHNVFIPVDTPPNVLEQNTDQDSYSGEFQHIFRRARFTLISGAGFFKADINDGSVVTILLPPPAPPVEISQMQGRDVRHTNLYLYSQINYLANAVLTVGGSADFFKGDLVDKSQFNPKLGLTWNPLPSTTIRAALFRTLKRMLVTSQTLEPTQVAGFNQFFDDADGTEAWVFGGAVDQKFSKDLYGGIEYYQRDLKVPAQVINQPPPPAAPVTSVELVDWKEYEGRAYLYWTPHPWLALSAEYLYEQLDRGSTFISGIKNVKTHRFPLGISFFHPSGFGAALKATYVNQNGRFQPRAVLVQSALTPENMSIPGADSFWIVDASVNYRLPKRCGIVSIIGKNLFDKSFRYQDTDPVSPLIQPKRTVYFKFTFAL
ncbi:TPR repeat protein [Candidatus Sulfobium mesophilum]|uniref:TPR repeat protein n=1 Tax=Candidatus Sulfobium mesophilum TaxID=2016548 RepID=A0A2U3QKI7_9BACT|nr:TPR repeat protein [Candidatus Sulfobium mesophilum]